MQSTNKPSLDHLPQKAGIYVFKDAAGLVLYIGKAKSIKKRVQSYFHKQGKDWKIDALLTELCTIECIQTNNEEEALLLEAQLIQQHKPKFNVLLVSGQPFVYILFTKEPVSKVKLVRNKREKGTYFGPFLHKNHARGAYAYLLKTFCLEWCNTEIENGCLRYHLDLCVGNCRPSFTPDAYLFRLQLAQELLKGRYEESLSAISQQIKKYNAAFEFELARALHEYARNLHTIFTTLQTKFSERKYADEASVVTAPVSPRQQRDEQLAYELQALLQTAEPIRTIDCFDISHFQSSSIVGSCIRFVDGVPDRNAFRRFRIKSLTEQNDYAALQEIVARRYANPNDMPDLIVIDGGKGQLHAVKKILPGALIVSLAKREERLFIDIDSHGIVQDIHSRIGKLFIALRDYAHHFAISYHRLRRKKALNPD
ncbi:MAG: GIY-YIG nuclease family protein [Candidatus Babeliales bacterium]